MGMNKDIGLQAKKGAAARMLKMTPTERKACAQKAAWARWHPLSPEEEEVLRLEREEEAAAREQKKAELVDSYLALRRFIESKGGDPDDIIEQSREVSQY